MLSMLSTTKKKTLLFSYDCGQENSKKFTSAWQVLIRNEHPRNLHLCYNIDGVSVTTQLEILQLE